MMWEQLLQATSCRRFSLNVGQRDRIFSANVVPKNRCNRVGAFMLSGRYTYPDLAEQIREIGGKTTRAQRDAKHADLVKERETNRTLRAENAILKEDVAKLASVNQTLLAEIAVLKGMASGKVVTPLRNPVKES